MSAKRSLPTSSQRTMPKRKTKSSNKKQPKKRISKKSLKRAKIKHLPKKVTEQEFQAFILPHLSLPKRGFVSKIPLWKIFNYVLHHLHTELLGGTTCRSRSIRRRASPKSTTPGCSDGSGGGARTAASRGSSSPRCKGFMRLRGSISPSSTATAPTTSLKRGIADRLFGAQAPEGQEGRPLDGPGRPRARPHAGQAREYQRIRAVPRELRNIPKGGQGTRPRRPGIAFQLRQRGGQPRRAQAHLERGDDPEHPGESPEQRPIKAEAWTAPIFQCQSLQRTVRD